MVIITIDEVFSTIQPLHFRCPQIIQEPKGPVGPAPTGLSVARAPGEPGGLLPGERFATRDAIRVGNQKHLSI